MTRRRFQLTRFLAICGLLYASAACGGSANTRCVPRRSVSCTVPGGCAGNQVCNSSGTAYGACTCGGPVGAPDDSGTPDGGADAGAAADSSTTKDSSPGDSPFRDSGPGSDACAPTPSWDPSMLPGLVVWLNDEGIFTNASGYVVNWVDKSGNGNEAYAVGTGGSNNLTIDPGAANGHDAIRSPGNGVGLQIPDAPTIRFGASGFLLAMVARTGASDGVQLFGNGVGGGLLSVWEDYAGDYVFSIGGESFFSPYSIPVAPLDHAHFLSVIAVRPAMELWSDGVASGKGPTNTENVDNPGYPLLVFASAGPASGASDEIAEVVIAKGTPSCSDVASLQAYFKTKFAMP